MKGMDVSIILTFHDEGIVIHKTFLALGRMLKRLDENKISYEIIAHIDNGDSRTTEYIESIADKWELRVFKNSFGEPAKSRNFAIKKARGKYVCLMDGDDIFSEDWLLSGYRMLEASKEDVILHPEYNITFGLGEQPRIWRMSDSFDMETDLLILFGRNRWCSGTFLKKSIGERIPYETATGCYGFEDWWYNCETRFRGVKHKIVPKSILFYRVRRNSTYSRHISGNTTIPYTDAFSLTNVKKIYKAEFEDVTVQVPSSNKILNMLRVGHKILRHTPIIKKTDKRITEAVEQRRGKKRLSSLPVFLREEWKQVNRIDSELYPDVEVLARMPEYISEYDYLGKTFCKLLHRISAEPDYVFMMPIMGVGGTEKVLENYLKGIYELHPEWRVLVLGKLPDNHPYKIPPNVDFVDFDGITEGYCEWDKFFLITRMLVQLKVKRVHIVNNDFYYRFVIQNEQLFVQNNIIINVSFFMHEFSVDEKRIQSFADTYLLELEPYINKIFTDNASIVDDLIKRTGFSREKFSVHYQPVSLNMRAPKSLNGKNNLHRVLWAGRIAPQKRPDILKKVAEVLPENYKIEAYGRIQKPYFEDGYLNGVRNLKYIGEFNDITKLPVENFDAYLYTAQTDGIPNILLEVSALGLPIIATNEGGVPDFIKDCSSGRLVDLNDIDGYVDAIVDTIENEKGVHYVKAAQKKIKERHNWKNYIKTIKKDF